MSTFRVLTVAALAAISIGCTHNRWYLLDPPLADVVGSAARIGEHGCAVPFSPRGDEERTPRPTTRQRPGPSQHLEVTKTHAATIANLCFKAIGVKTSVAEDSIVAICATDVVVDDLANPQLQPENVMYIASGMRSKKVVICAIFSNTAHIELKNTYETEYGTFLLDVAKDKDKLLVMTIDNPKVYYKVRLARNIIVFPDKFVRVVVRDGDPRLLSQESPFSDEVEPPNWWFNNIYNTILGCKFGYRKAPTCFLELDVDNRLCLRIGEKSHDLSGYMRKENESWHLRKRTIDGVYVADDTIKYVSLTLDARRLDDGIQIQQCELRFEEIQYKTY